MFRFAFLALFMLFAVSVSAQSSVSVITSTTTNDTTTPTPSPTTNQTDTESPTTNATTPEPTTIPTTVSPTLPSPTLPPEPPVVPQNPWKVENANGSVCIMALFAAQIQIKYNRTENSTLTAGFNIPANASVNPKFSSCNASNDTQVLALTFDVENQTSGLIIFTFNKTGDKVSVQSLRIQYNLTENLLPYYINRTQYNQVIEVEKNETDFSFTGDHSYVCSAQKTISLNNLQNVATDGAELLISNLKFQAFIPNGQKDFSSEQNCASSQVSDVVPIAVGAALAGLVIIVLIAYFVGRRRSRRLAYQSV